MNIKDKHVVLLALLGTWALLTTLPTNAQNVTWNAAGGNTSWNTPANWAGGSVPASTNSVVFSSSGTLADLGGAQTANSLSFNGSTAAFTINDSSASSTGLTLTSGNLSAAENASTAIPFTINSNLTLGANGSWTTTSGGTGGPNLTVNGSIQGAFGISLTSSTHSTVTLTGSNSFSGGLTLNGWGSGFALNLRNSNALGSGPLTIGGAVTNSSTINFGSATTGGTATYANNIVFNNPTGTSPTVTISVDPISNPSSVTLGAITGTAGTPTQIYTSLNSTMVFSQGITETGLNGNGIDLRTGMTTGVGTYLFKAGTGSNFIQFVGASAGSGSANLLFATTQTIAGLIFIGGGATATGIDTLGVATSTGTTTFSGNLTTTSAVGAGAVRLVALTNGTRAIFSGSIGDGTNTVGLQVNSTFTDNINGTNTPVGTVQLSKATGNIYKGTTDVYAGTLIVSNSSASATGTGAVNIRSTATLGGTGIIAPGGSNGITVQSGGIVKPGDGAVGVLTFNGASTSGTLATFSSGAKFVFTLNATAHTSSALALINGAAGDFAFNDNVIDFSNLSGSLAQGQTYTLFTATDPTQYAGLIVDGSNVITSGLSVGSGLGGFGGVLSLSGNNIVLSVVPEPTTFLLALTGLTVVCLAHKRNRKR